MIQALKIIFYIFIAANIFTWVLLFWMNWIFAEAEKEEKEMKEDVCTL